MSLRLRLAPLLAALALSALPAAAAASSTISSNWSGYAIHGPHVRFQRAVGSWQIPTDTCTTRKPAYSAAWVGIGGYELSSRALEQTGTESDCNRHHRVITYAWFEIVPAPSHHFRLRVRPGDRMTATVLVVGHHVTLSLTDRTTGRTATKVSNARVVDVSSAEWIVEAPSECNSTTSCITLPLADFGTVHFTRSTAQDARGRVGAIASRLWNRTKITLLSGGHHLVPTGSPRRTARPSVLAPSGAGFRVGFAMTKTKGTPPPRTGSPTANPGSPITVGHIRLPG